MELSPIGLSHNRDFVPSHYTVDLVKRNICAFPSMMCVMFLMYSPFIGPNTCLNQSLDVCKISYRIVCPPLSQNVFSDKADDEQ